MDTPSLELWPRALRPKKDRDPRDQHDVPVIKDTVAHGEGMNNPDPDLAWFLRQVNKWLAKLGVDTQTSVEFLQGCEELLRIAALASNIRRTRSE